MNDVDVIIKTVLSDISKRKNTIRGLSIGFAELDRILSGLNNGNLIVIAGHPGIGTTSFALRITEHLSIDNNLPGLFFSVANESKEQLVEKMLLGRAKISLRQALEGDLQKKQFDSLNKICTQISNKPIYFDDTARPNPSELFEKAKIIQKLKNIKFIVVDYLQFLRLKNKIELHENDFAEIAENLKCLALELNIPILLLAHLDLDLNYQEEKASQPKLTDLGEAIILERYADVIMLINRENYYSFHQEDCDSTEIMIVKNHNGPTGMVALNFYKEYGRFENIGNK